LEKMIDQKRKKSTLSWLLLVLCLTFINIQAVNASFSSQDYFIDSNTYADNNSGLFLPYQAIPVGSHSEAVAIGDLNNDGRNDVVLSTSYYFDPPNDYSIFVFSQDSNGELGEPTRYSAGNGKSVDIGDVNNDGRADVVVTANNAVGVFIQNVSGGLEPMVTYPHTHNVFKVRIGDFNNDGRLDVATIEWGTGPINLSIFLQNNEGALNIPTSYPINRSGSGDLDVGDVNNDGLDDIVIGGKDLGYTGTISVLTQEQNGAFSLPLHYDQEPALGEPSISPQGIAIGDISNDSLQDIVASIDGNSPRSKITVLLQNKLNTLDTPVAYPAYDLPGSIEIADINLDGRNDVIVVHGGWHSVGVFLQNSTGALLPYERYAVPYQPYGLAVGDINGDGANDIAIADYHQGLVLLYNNYTDSDNDSINDAIDACLGSVTNWISDNSSDNDNDGCRDSDEDLDDDNDGVLDSDDVFPLDASESTDTDNDGIGNTADTDDDNDGISDIADTCPAGAINWTSNSATDKNGDGCRDIDEEMHTVDYFPLQTGNSWTYLNNGSTHNTLTVLSGTANVNGLATKQLRNSYGDLTYYSNDANGLRLHKEADASDSATYNPPIKHTHSKINIGDTIPSSGTATFYFAEYGTFTLSYTATARVLATESVTVPLDTFQAIKIELSIRFTGTIQGTPIDLSQVETIWTAKHLGPVMATLASEGLIDVSALTAASIFSTSSIAWTDRVGVTVEDGTLIKTGATGWNSGAASVRTIPGDGAIEFSAVTTDAYRMLGLSNSNASASYDTIGYAIYLRTDGTLSVYENGMHRGRFGTYQGDDVLRVERIGSTVVYKRNGAIFYTSAVPSTGALLADAALRDSAARFADARIIGVPAVASDTDGDGIPDDWETANGLDYLNSSDAIQDLDGNDTSNLEEYQRDIEPKPTVSGIPIAWTDRVGVTVENDSLIKTSATGWNSGAVSVQTIPGDGAVEFAAVSTDTYRMLGLSNSNASASYDTIGYAIYLRTDGTLSVYENGTHRGRFGTYQNTDVLRVERIGSTVVYKRNEAIFYTSAVPSTGALLADAALRDSAARFNDARIIGVPAVASDTDGDGIPDDWETINGLDYLNSSDAIQDLDGNGISNLEEYQRDIEPRPSVGGIPIAWIDRVGVTVENATLIKTGTTGWNSGAASVRTIPGDGAVEFAAVSTDTYRMLGLSNSNASASYDTIGYAIYLRTDGTLSVYENGTNRGRFGTYQGTDVLRVERIGSTVVYKRNGEIFYTSVIPSVGTLLADAALRDAAARFNDARIIGVPAAASDTDGDGIPDDWEKANGLDHLDSSDAAQDLDRDGISNLEMYQYDIGSAVGGAPIAWTDRVDVTVENTNLIKTGTTGWNSGAASVQTIPGDGAVEFAAVSTDTYRMLGLSNSNASASYDTIGYAIYLRTDGTLSIYENGTHRGRFGTYQDTDILRIERKGSTVVYRRDGTIFYTSTIPATGALLVDAALRDSAAHFDNARIIGVPAVASDTDGDGIPDDWETANGLNYLNSNDAIQDLDGNGISNLEEYQRDIESKPTVSGIPIAWTDRVGVTVEDDALIKTSATGWNSGAASVQTISGNGAVEFTAVSTDTYRMLGLSNSNASASYDTIGYAIYLRTDGTLSVYENGTHRGRFGTYQSTDVLRVERSGSNVVYKRNGAVFYTSTVPSTGTLLADAALRDSGAHFDNVYITSM